MSADDTGEQQRGRPFKPGQSGNPKGRPKGSRNKLGEDFFRDLVAEWEASGPEALASARAVDPVAFVRVVASLMPKEAEVTIRNEFDKMTDAELREFITRELAGSGQSGPTDELSENSGVTH